MREKGRLKRKVPFSWSQQCWAAYSCQLSRLVIWKTAVLIAKTSSRHSFCGPCILLPLAVELLPCPAKKGTVLWVYMICYTIADECGCDMCNARDFQASRTSVMEVCQWWKLSFGIQHLMVTLRTTSGHSFEWSYCHGTPLQASTFQYLAVNQFDETDLCHEVVISPVQQASSHPFDECDLFLGSSSKNLYPDLWALSQQWVCHCRILS